MGERKHTPGPWMYLGANPWSTPSGEFVQWGEFRISANSLDTGDEDYYRIGSVSNANDDGTNEANARLITAAPELLEALINLHAVARVDRDENYAAITSAAAVIAKATLAPKDTQ